MNEISHQVQEEINLLLSTDRDIEQFTLQDVGLELEKTKLELERAKLEIAGARMMYAKTERNFQKRNLYFKDHYKLRYIESRIHDIQAQAAHLQDVNHEFYSLTETFLADVNEKTLALKVVDLPIKPSINDSLDERAQQHRLTSLAPPQALVMQSSPDQLSLKEIALVLQTVALNLKAEVLRLQQAKFIFNKIPLLQLEPLLYQLQNQLQATLYNSFALRETNTYFAMICACFDQAIRFEKQKLDEKKSLDEKLEENLLQREEETKQKTLAQRMLEHRLKPFLWRDS